LDTLATVAEKRAATAGVSITEIFASPDLVYKLARLSGGHLRYFLMLVRFAIDRSEALPISPDAVNRAIRRAVTDLMAP
jgi:hypothetical protein